MKIEEWNIHSFIDVMWQLKACATDAFDGDEEAYFLKMVEVLEQHHKDLMGLVEAWREQAEVTMDVSRETYLLEFADDLASLINPKD